MADEVLGGAGGFDSGLDQAGCFFDHFAAVGIAVSVIEGLEVVQIDDTEGEGMIRIDPFFQYVLDGDPAGQPGERARVKIHFFELAQPFSHCEKGVGKAADLVGGPDLGVVFVVAFRDPFRRDLQLLERRRDMVGHDKAGKGPREDAGSQQHDSGQEGAAADLADQLHFLVLGRFCVCGLGADRIDKRFKDVLELFVRDLLCFMHLALLHEGGFFGKVFHIRSMETLYLLQRKVILILQVRQRVEPGPELITPLHEEVLHCAAFHDQEPLFVNILGKERIQHLVRSFLDRDVHGNDAFVQGIEALQAHERIDHDDERQKHKHHIAQEHLARDVQFRKKAAGYKSVEDPGWQGELYAGEVQFHVSRVARNHSIVK